MFNLFLLQIGQLFAFPRKIPCAWVILSLEFPGKNSWSTHVWLQWKFQVHIAMTCTGCLKLPCLEPAGFDGLGINPLHRRSAMEAPLLHRGRGRKRNKSPAPQPMECTLEAIEDPMTQWFCWSLSLRRMAISLGVYPIFRHTHLRPVSRYPLVNCHILQWKITMFNGKIHYKWPFSIAMLAITRGYFKSVNLHWVHYNYVIGTSPWLVRYAHWQLNLLQICGIWILKQHFSCWRNVCLQVCVQGIIEDHIWSYICPTALSIAFWRVINCIELLVEWMWIAGNRKLGAGTNFKKPNAKKCKTPIQQVDNRFLGRLQCKAGNSTCYTLRAKPFCLRCSRCKQLSADLQLLLAWIAAALHPHVVRSGFTHKPSAKISFALPCWKCSFPGSTWNSYMYIYI